MAGAAGALFAAFGLAIGLLWFTLEPPPAEVRGTPADPLASRRQAPEPPDETQDGHEAASSSTTGPAFEEVWPDADALDAGIGQTGLAALEETVAAGPDEAGALSALAQDLLRHERFDDAIRHLEQAVALEPEEGTYQLNLARGLALAGRWDASIAAYREAQRRLPGHAAIPFELGLTLHKSGNDAAAVAAYAQAVALDPSEPSFRLATAVSHERLQNRAEAAIAYGEYLRLAPNGPEAERARIRLSQLSIS